LEYERERERFWRKPSDNILKKIATQRQTITEKEAEKKSPSATTSRGESKKKRRRKKEVKWKVPMERRKGGSIGAVRKKRKVQEAHFRSAAFKNTKH